MKEQFSHYEKEDIRCREDMKHAKAKAKKLEKNLEQEQKKVRNTELVPWKYQFWCLKNIDSTSCLFLSEFKISCFTSLIWNFFALMFVKPPLPVKRACCKSCRFASCSPLVYSFHIWLGLHCKWHLTVYVCVCLAGGVENDPREDRTGCRWPEKKVRQIGNG